MGLGLGFSFGGQGRQSHKSGENCILYEQGFHYKAWSYKIESLIYPMSLTQPIHTVPNHEYMHSLSHHGNGNHRWQWSIHVGVISTHAFLWFKMTWGTHCPHEYDLVSIVIPEIILLSFPHIYICRYLPRSVVSCLKIIPYYTL